MTRYKIDICIDALNDADAEFLAGCLVRQTKQAGYNTADRAMVYRSVPLSESPGCWKWLEEIKSEAKEAKRATSPG